MKQTLKLGTAIILGCAMLAAPALGASLTGTGAQTQGALVQEIQASGQDQQQGGENEAANLEFILGAIESSEETATEIQEMPEPEGVNVIPVAALVTQKSHGALQSAINEHREKILTLQDAVNNNEAVRSRLEARQVAPANVLAARVEDDGSVSLFVI